MGSGNERNLSEEYQMNDEEAQAVIDEMEDMDIENACRYLEENYQFYGAIYTYEDTAWHLGTREEINEYLKEKTEDRPFSWYFSRKFADFAGLYTEFFAVVMLAALFTGIPEKILMNFFTRSRSARRHM